MPRSRAGGPEGETRLVVEEAIVLQRAAGKYRVLTGGEVREASLRGRVKQDAGGVVVPGDRVEVRLHDDGSMTIERLIPRRSVLQRRTPGRRRGVRIVAANVDRVVVVGAVVDPPWDSMMIDRFLAVVEANDLAAILVINKSDLAPGAPGLADGYRRIGYPVFVTSAKVGLGVDELFVEIKGVTALFTGSTGVGKSSLLNAIEPGLALKTAEVSQKSRTGRHTTVAAIMCPVDGGGFLVDTPGLRDISLWGLTPDEVEKAFPEIREQGSACRFDDCRHGSEPDCTVRSAVAEGEIMASRLASFRRLLEEATDAARPWR